jgi:hypothetical protein
MGKKIDKEIRILQKMLGDGYEIYRLHFDNRVINISFTLGFAYTVEAGVFEQFTDKNRLLLLSIIKNSVTRRLLEMEKLVGDKIKTLNTPQKT